MIQSNQKTSLFIPSQLPEYLLDTSVYGNNFVTFLQAYYEWMELANTANANTVTADTNGTQGALYASKSLWDYTDIDNTLEGFQQYFINDFLQYFPAESLISPTTAVKIARQLYQSKGTPASYQFLFRVLFDSDFDYFYTKDAVLAASSGKWYVPKSILLETSDTNFLAAVNYKVFGLISKSFATIENVILADNKIEIFISDIERLFQSGESVTIVDAYNQPVYFLNGKVVPAGTSGAETLTAVILGQISQININPTARGLGYNVADPVIVYGGLNSNVANPIGAIAEVASVTTGSIQDITVVNGGYGYSTFPPSGTSLYPGNAVSLISITGQQTSGANATVFSVASGGEATITIPIDSIAVSNGFSIGNTLSFLSANTSATANATLANALTFTTIQTNPIGSVVLNNGGGGINYVPVATAQSQYVSNDTTNNIFGSISSLGILAPIQIANTGTGYSNNDTIVFTGGCGYGANARIRVNANGSIINVMYQAVSGLPSGGLGYIGGVLPNVSIQTSTGSNATIYVPGTLGSGATFSLTLNQIGAVSLINVLQGGEDYTGTPNVSLVVQDIVVSNLIPALLPVSGETLYQGANVNVASYIATVNSISLLQQNGNPRQSVYNLRVFNYTSQPNPTLPLLIKNTNINMAMVNTAYGATQYTQSVYNQYGVRNYGDGNARASTKYLNGLVIGQGQYLTSSGQLSSYDVLQSKDYNNFTYQITVEKAISDYRSTLLNLLHPSGVNLIGRYALKSNTVVDYDIEDTLATQEYLNKIIGTNNVQGTMNVADNQYVASANIYYHGYNYQANDILTISGGTSVYPAQIKVLSVYGSANDIGSFVVSNVGNYSVFPTNPVSVTGGAGSTAQFNLAPDYLNYSANTISIGYLPTGNYINYSTFVTMTTANNFNVVSGLANVNFAANTVTLTDSVWVRFANVAYGTGNSNSSIINISNVYTDVYNIINDGVYSNTSYPIIDVIQTNDVLSSNGYYIGKVQYVDYANSIVYLTSNSALTFTSNIAVKKIPVANANQILLTGPIGVQYIPYIITEDGYQLVTEDGQNILLG